MIFIKIDALVISIYYVIKQSFKIKQVKIEKSSDNQKISDLWHLGVKGFSDCTV
jgi:hypothetical protein